MPLFFFLSGYLEKNKNIKETVISGIKTLIIPYVILYCLDYLWWFPVSLLRHPEVYGEISLDNALLKPLWGMIFGVGYGTDFSIMVDVPLWFLVGLFFVKIIHSIIRYITKDNILCYILSSFIMIGIIYVIKHKDIDILFSIDSALLAFPFFSIGNILKRKHLMNRFESVCKYSLLRNMTIAIIGYITLVVIVPFNGRIDINGCGYGKNIILFYIIALIGIMSTVFLSLVYKNKNKIITIIANGTIIIMAFHGIVTPIIFRIIGLRGADIIINPIIGIFVSLTNVLMFIVPTLIVKKYFPIILGRRK
jgi:fucose 4-O-acetylase-like acetyltransferase